MRFVEPNTWLPTGGDVAAAPDCSSAEMVFIDQRNPLTRQVSAGEAERRGRITTQQAG